MRKSRILILPALVLGGLIGQSFFLNPDFNSQLLSLASSVKSACNIKGNISHNTGEHIYHVPGQRYYDETRINILAGEKWFCSEPEATAAGWRKSRV